MPPAPFALSFLAFFAPIWHETTARFARVSAQRCAAVLRAVCKGVILSSCTSVEFFDCKVPSSAWPAETPEVASSREGDARQTRASLPVSASRARACQQFRPRLRYDIHTVVLVFYSAERSAHLLRLVVHNYVEDEEGDHKDAHGAAGRHRQSVRARRDAASRAGGQPSARVTVTARPPAGARLSGEGGLHVALQPRKLPLDSSPLRLPHASRRARARALAPGARRRDAAHPPRLNTRAGAAHLRMMSDSSMALKPPSSAPPRARGDPAARSTPRQARACASMRGVG